MPEERLSLRFTNDLRLSFGVEIHYLEDERLGDAEAASRGGRSAPVMSVVLNLGQRDQVRTSRLGFKSNLKQQEYFNTSICFK